MAYGLLNFFVGAPLKMLFLKQVKGEDNIPKPPFIVAANHSSVLDPMLLAKIFYDKGTYTRYLANLKRYNNDAQWLVDYFSLIPIHEDRAILNKRILQVIKKKEVIAIFPGGSYSKDGEVQEFKNGVGRIAVLTKVPILPVAIIGTFDICPGATFKPKLQKKVCISIGKPLTFQTKDYKKITKKVHSEIKKLFKSR